MVGDDEAVRTDALDERIERRQRTLAHAGPVDRQHLGDLVVRATARQHEFEHGSLIGRQVV